MLSSNLTFLQNEKIFSLIIEWPLSLWEERIGNVVWWKEQRLKFLGSVSTLTLLE